MKRIFSVFALCLLAVGVTGAALAFAAPKPKVTKKPVIAVPTTQLITPPQKISPVGSGATGFKPSRFRGVSVRHVPQASPSRMTQGVGRRGVTLRNLRRAPDPRNGVMADVDLGSVPEEVHTIKPVASKKAAHKPSAKR